MVEEFISGRIMNHMCSSSGRESSNNTEGQGKGWGSEGEGEGPQPDKMATHGHRHYRHHRHSRRCRIGAPDRISNHPRTGGVWREGGGRRKGERGRLAPQAH